MIWIKYAHKSSAGIGEWEWQDVTFTNGDKKEIQNYVEDYLVYNIWSEKYYGVKWEIAIPPKEIVKDYIYNMKSEIRSLKTSTKLAKKYLKESYKNEI